MSHCRVLVAALRVNVRVAHTNEDAAVSARLAKALAALLLEHAQLRATRLAVDDTGDPGVGDERCAGENLSRVLCHEQHLIEGHFRPLIARPPIDFDNGAWRDLQLATTGLDDGVHSVTSYLVI